MNGKIYKYFNEKKYKETGIESYYIGQTIQTISKRAGKDGVNYLQRDTKFSRAIKKWGWEAFSVEILEENVQTHEELNELETKYITEYNSYVNGYNMTTGGQENSELDEESRKKMSQAKKGKPNGRKGNFTHSEKSKQKIKETIAKNGHHYKGQKFSEEHRQKISDSTKKRRVFCIELNLAFNSVKEAGEYFGMKKPSNISMVCNGKRSSAGSVNIDGKLTKLTWRYLEDDEVQTNEDVLVEINKPVTKRQVYCNELGMVFGSIIEAGEYAGLSKKGSAHITAVCKGKKLHAGSKIIDGKLTKLTWKYID